MKKLCIIIFLSASLLFLTTSCISYGNKKQIHLHIRDSETGRIIWKSAVCYGDEFSLEYIHSVHKTPVIDYYRIENDNQLLLYKTAFSTFGAGMPYESNYDFQIEEGFFVIDNLSKRIDRILLRVVSLANHSLSLHDETVFMNDLVPSSALIAIYVE